MEAIAPSLNDRPEAVAFPPLTKTTGEKWFDAVRFITGETVILALTGGIAYISMYGKEAYGPIPNVFKKLDRVIKEKLGPRLAHLNGHGDRITAAIAGATVLMHGGNAFIPVKKWLQNRKEAIVTYFNQHRGHPGEVEEGIERVRAQEKENWGDVIKGRIGGWLVIFASFISADLIAGKKKGHEKYRFDEYNEAFGKWLAGFTKKGKEIAERNPSVTEHIAELEKAGSKTFRLGKILALDIYATAAALLAWNAISRISAMLRKEETQEKQILAHADVPVSPVPDESKSAEQGGKHSYMALAGDRPADYRTLARKEPSPSGIALP